MLMESRSHSDFTTKLLDFDWFLEKYVDIYDSAKHMTQQTEEAATKYSEVLLRRIQYDNVNNNQIKNQEKSSFYQDLAFPNYLIKDKTHLPQSSSRNSQLDYCQQFLTSDFRGNSHPKKSSQGKSSSNLRPKQKEEKKICSNFEFMRDFLDTKLNNKGSTKTYNGLNVKEYAENLCDELRNVCEIDSNIAYMTSFSRVSSASTNIENEEQEKRRSTSQKQRNGNAKLIKGRFDEDFEDIYVTEREDIDKINKKVKIGRD